MPDHWPDRLRMLVSYAYASNAAMEGIPGGIDLVVDSGAYTAFSTGRTFDRDDYAAFLHRHAERITFALSLDVIGDASASLHNYLHLREAVGERVRVLPTWHIGSTWEELAHLCTLTDYVSIGGAVPYRDNRHGLMRHLVRAHQIARDHGARLHGLGITGTRPVRDLPWASVDSSSWTIPYRFSAYYFATNSGRMIYVRGGAPITPDERRTIRKYGITPESLTYGVTSTAHVGKERARDMSTRLVISCARSYMVMESRVSRHRPFRLYLAGTPSDAAPTEPPAVAHALGDPFTPAPHPRLTLDRTTSHA